MIRHPGIGFLDDRMHQHGRTRNLGCIGISRRSRRMNEKECTYEMVLGALMC